jgi:DNA-directed RNA polymerase subunit RPC12/RpoP
MTEINRVGKDTFWDTEQHKFRKRRFNLEKVPIKFRCPKCGKILVKPKDREKWRFTNMLTPEWIEGRDRQRKAFREEYPILPPEKDFPKIYEDFNKRHPELTQYWVTYEISPIYISEAMAWGGVCLKCFLAGFGKYGELGAFIRRARSNK